ncbi:cysteine-rich CWC family protein [Ferruginibacter albus]|uniref:cysteine-rich CWC family protein n=1 Tax=Ferruginibacter albus TaxID=2875540 RepID=UPI001CC79CC5|nr:cysteine-rich CWC family protein [Ferruginibacter albus]UAY52163.1 cysteine-rich CWC family protein [Ferruginibacter albus]
MKKHEEKYCPRCKAVFECKVGDIVNCQCGAVTISDETKRFLQKTRYDCLCNNCLRQINEMVKFSHQHSFPLQKELLVEGLHYTMEKGLFVFTELYHIQRGACCGNNCKHCAYGYQ